MTTTPLAFNQSGEGWHLKPGRSLVQKATGVLVLVMFTVFALVMLLQGKLLTAPIVFVVGLALGTVPFSRDRRRLPPRPLVLDGQAGLLIPTHPMRLAIVAALGLLGAVALLGSGFAFVVAIDRRDVGAGLGGLFVLALSLLFLVGAYAGLRARRSPDRGLVLLPDGVVLRTRSDPTRLHWDDVASVRDHWARLIRTGATSPGDQVRNWLTFVPHQENAWPPDPLAAMSGTKNPSVDVTTFAQDPHLVLAVVRFYLDHPGSRAELASDQAVARIDSIARTAPGRTPRRIPRRTRSI